MQPKELETLLQRLAANSLTDEERTRLGSLLGNESGKEEVMAVLQQGMMEENAGSVFDEERFMPLLQRLLRADRQAQVVPIINRGRKTWWVAAAVLLLIMGAAVVFMRTQHTKNDPAVAGGQSSVADAIPGGSKAVLTLGNGSQIILDSAHIGMLTQQGNTRIIKTGSGRLSYTASDGRVGSASDEKGGAAADNILTTPRGGQYQLTLPDGSQVWLNASSSIRYPTAFTGRERKVAITGEAYFEVAKDSHKPFRVMVNDVEVDVLGTHFNIDAYSDEAAVTATLLEGSVRVIRDPGQAKSGAAGQSIVLGPGQQARLEQGQLKMIAGSDMEQVMAWKNGLFQFRRTDLATVMRQLARWYDLDVVYEGKVPDVRFDGKIPRDAMASQVLGVLEKNQVHFRIEGKRLIVMP